MDDKQPKKIIYWYDSNISMYTFQVLDEEGNQIEPCYYTSRWHLKATKDSYYKSHGVMPVKY